MRAHLPIVRYGWRDAARALARGCELLEYLDGHAEILNNGGAGGEDHGAIGYLTRQSFAKLKAARLWPLRKNMNKNVKKMIGEPVEPEKSIESAVPEIIRILSGGSLTWRVAQFLVSQGFNEQDVWRELKKLPLSSPFTSNLLDAVRSIGRGSKGDSDYAAFGEDLERLRFYLKQKKKKKKAAMWL